MSKQKQYLTYKFNSDRLKKFNYDINITVQDAIQTKELIAIFENQLVDSILDITNHHIDFDEIDSWKREIKRIKKEPASVENGSKIANLYKQINEATHVPEYITIKMINKKHYDYLYHNGVYINGKKYIRFNASASQARVNTVLFVQEDIFSELRRVTDNGRNLNKPIAPSKLNAYRGLYCSSRHKVSTPKFCVIRDYESDCDMKVNFVTETPYDEDDTVEIKEVTRTFNRFDGQGLISPTYARQWANELELEHIPSQFCIRGSFLKGMLCTFDFHKWCEKINNGNYMIETAYEDENGNPVYADLRNIDVIITESQLKLWDSWDSVEHYVKCCEENNLSWGVTLYAPNHDKTFFHQNYQFLQTLDLDDKDVINITEKFVKWVKGATSENIYYTMLFLVGMESDEKKFINFLNNSNNHWAKALILRPELIKDKYIKGKLYNLLKKKIKNASLGQIIVDGNFQVIVSDPYAMIEGAMLTTEDKANGKPIKGLLQKGEYYSNYWNQLNVNKVVASRSPLTYRSEHVLMDLVKTDDTEDWYKYCYSGIILNAHGDDTDRFAGSDFDYDILATTSDKSVIKGVFKGELPVVYDAPKPKKVVPAEDDLYKADIFSFDSIIGGLTNKSTSGYALLAEFPVDSEEHKTTLTRIKTITKAQSAQIDKTKIGQNVKGIVPKWVDYKGVPKDEHGNYIEESNEDKEKRRFNNKLLLKKHPYFFTNLYKNTQKDYKKHVKTYEILCLQKLGITLNELRNKPRRTTDEQDFLNDFKYNSPVIESDCVMNKICRRIESIDFEIKNLLKMDNEDLHELFTTDADFDNEVYKKVVSLFKEYSKESHATISNAENTGKSKVDLEVKQQLDLVKENFKVKLLEVCSNSDELVNYLVKMFYVDHPSFSKDVMWTVFGEEITSNLMKNTETIHIPILDVDGEMEYLNNNYTIKEVYLNEFK